MIVSRQICLQYFRERTQMKNANARSEANQQTVSIVSSKTLTVFTLNCVDKVVADDV